MDDKEKTTPDIDSLLHRAFRSSGNIGYYMLYSALKRKGGDEPYGNKDQSPLP